MRTQSAGTSSAEVATEVNGLSVGLGILTFTRFPLALPALLFVLAPLALVAVVGLVLAIPVVLPLWLVRTVRRSRSRRRGRAVPASGEIRRGAAGQSIQPHKATHSRALPSGAPVRPAGRRHAIATPMKTREPRAP